MSKSLIEIIAAQGNIKVSERDGTRMMKSGKAKPFCKKAQVISKRIESDKKASEKKIKDDSKKSVSESKK